MTTLIGGTSPGDGIAGGRNKTISLFAKLKLEYGRKQRSKLYSNELAALATDQSIDREVLEKLQKLTYTFELQELSAASEFPALNGNIAVIYSASMACFNNKLPPRMTLIWSVSKSDASILTASTCK